MELNKRASLSFEKYWIDSQWLGTEIPPNILLLVVSSRNKNKIDYSIEHKQNECLAYTNVKINRSESGKFQLIPNTVLYWSINYMACVSMVICWSNNMQCILGSQMYVWIVEKIEFFLIGRQLYLRLCLKVIERSDNAGEQRNQYNKVNSFMPNIGQFW